MPVATHVERVSSIDLGSQLEDSALLGRCVGLQWGHQGSVLTIVCVCRVGRDSEVRENGHAAPRERPKPRGDARTSRSSSTASEKRSSDALVSPPPESAKPAAPAEPKPAELQAATAEAPAPGTPLVTECADSNSCTPGVWLVCAAADGVDGYAAISLGALLC